MAKTVKEEVWLEHSGCGAIFPEAGGCSICPRCGFPPDEEDGALQRHPFKEGSEELPRFLTEHAPYVWAHDMGRVLALVASSSATKTTSP